MQGCRAVRGSGAATGRRVGEVARRPVWRPGRIPILALAVVLAASAGLPASAEADGLSAPIALNYQARVSSRPPGLEVKVVDGDERMWLDVASPEAVTVLDYRGAPYLRFSRLGVEVNHNSVMYLYQTQSSVNPPLTLGPNTPRRWVRASRGHAYLWSDARLYALSRVARPSGASFVGTWRIPLLVDGRATAISGGLWHRDPPSIVWFWPIVVLLLCVVAARRVRSPGLDRLTSLLLALGALAATVAAALGLDLHGRPGVPVLQFVELGLILIFAAWALIRVALGRAGSLTYLVIAIVTFFEGAQLIPTLVNGFVLTAVPAFVARAASAVGLGAGSGLAVVVLGRLFDPPRTPPAEAGGG